MKTMIDAMFVGLHNEALFRNAEKTIKSFVETGKVWIKNPDGSTFVLQPGFQMSYISHLESEEGRDGD